ncbi:MAG TPA: chemoreceptor glutamine deamidase CheD [Candidatus Aminicenantes bacterium]|nr:chemoreceptor glutamine deamidase CheD [Candidatus Aminicenantes bacterium]
MRKLFIAHFDREVRVLGMGERYVTDRDEGIGVVVGGCLTTCLYEEGTGVGGMNHFLVPTDFLDEEFIISPAARFGMYAMELLLGDLIKLRIQRERLRIKVFGGADLAAGAGLGARNLRFIKSYLELEGIPVTATDLGGSSPRKVLFFPKTGRVLVKKMSTETGRIAEAEEAFRQRAVVEL